MRRALLAVLAAAALAGCGGDDDKGPETPKPKETIQAFQARLQTAVAAIGQGQCGAVDEFNSKAGLSLPCDARAKKQAASFKVVGAKAYGTGGVVEFQNDQTGGGRGVYTIAIGEDGRFHLTGGPLIPVVETSTLNQKAEKTDEMDKAAERMVEAIRANDCEKFVAAVPPPQGLSKQDACRQELTEAYGPLRQQLNADKDAKPERLDGNAIFMFYALRTGSEYRTLIVRRTSPTGPYVGFVTFRGPAEPKKT